jgi:hypothetical protein
LAALSLKVHLKLLGENPFDVPFVFDPISRYLIDTGKLTEVLAARLHDCWP